MSQLFQFKQFSIRQRDSAMKVGTDGLILAASTPLFGNEKRILDVGSGTGLIALVLAQRSPISHIHAIEVDEKASAEAVFNFENSPFAERLSLENTSLQAFHQQLTAPEYDLIICNPPFFDGRQSTHRRKLARDKVELPPEVFIEAAADLLKSVGRLSLILPIKEEAAFLEKAKQRSLYPFEIMRVRGRKASRRIRSIMHFQKDTASKLIEKEICIELDQRHQYSSQYRELLKDFLLIF